MDGPGASPYPTLPPEPLPGTIRSPAEQHEQDLRDSLDETSTLERACTALREGSVEPTERQLTSCSCYEAALAIVRGELAKWAEYNRKNEAYNNYLDDKEAWEQRYREKREDYTSKRSFAGCGACGTQPNCNKKNLEGNWENTGSRSGCNFLGCKSQCKYSSKGLDSLMDSWTVTNPPPQEPQDPPIPEDISGIEFQCCSNEVSGDITLEEAARIIQECSQTIASDLDLTSKQKDKIAEEEEQRREDAIHTMDERGKSSGNQWVVILLSSIGGLLLAIIVLVIVIWRRKR